MTELALFASSFFTVLCLVIQSINNNHGYWGRAFFMSFAIGVSQLTLYRLMPSADIFEVIAFLCGGPFGNVAAHWIRRHDIARIRALREHDSNH